MQCPHCGKSNEDKTGKQIEVHFCMWCGLDPQRTLCSKCKRDMGDLPEEILFCPDCGADLFEIKGIWTRENVTKEMLRKAKATPKILLEYLSGRTANAVARSEVTAFQMLTSKDDLLLTLRNFGPKSIKELDEAILHWNKELEEN